MNRQDATELALGQILAQLHEGERFVLAVRHDGLVHASVVEGVTFLVDRAHRYPGDAVRRLAVALNGPTPQLDELRRLCKSAKSGGT